MKCFNLCDFDFSGKRVKYLGKALTKFDLSCFIGRLECYSAYSIYPDSYPYKDYANKLFSLLSC